MFNISIKEQKTITELYSIRVKGIISTMMNKYSPQWWRNAHLNDKKYSPQWWRNTHHNDGDSSKTATNISDLGETSLRYLRNIEIEDLPKTEVILHFNTGFKKYVKVCLLESLIFFSLRKKKEVHERTNMIWAWQPSIGMWHNVGTNCLLYWGHGQYSCYAITLLLVLWYAITFT